MYILNSDKRIIRIIDNAAIPADTANSDYQAYLAWLEEGNEPEPADVPPTPTIEQERGRARTTLNPLRDTFLNRLAGIAVFTQDEAVKSECAELRAAILDITKDPAFLAAETYEAMKVAILQRYTEIAATASLTIKNVFRELNQEVL